jgi:hypothetical protein
MQMSANDRVTVITKADVGNLKIRKEDIYTERNSALSFRLLREPPKSVHVIFIGAL